MAGARYQLDPDEVLATVRRLRERIGERFPGSGLHVQARELERIGERTRERVEWISRPIWPLRLGTLLLVALLIAGAAMAAARFHANPDGWAFKDALEILESGINNMVMIAIGIFFLVTMETRMKRARALHAIHELRSMAHVIDMHQLTKDPDRLRKDRANTEHSPKSDLTAFELRRYLDYCSEMLSLVSKIASTYLQNFEDSQAVGAVNEIESLTTGLSRKIWQKITLLQ